MAPPPIERVLHLGFRFEPKPLDAITYYLPRLIASEPMHVVVHSTDVYAFEPAVFAAQFRPTPKTGNRFFFTTFKRQPGKAARVAGPGSWHLQVPSADIKDGAGVKIGEVKKPRYKESGRFTDWLMEELSSCAAGTIVGDRQYSLCRMYVAPMASPDSAARQESAAFIPPHPPAPEGQGQELVTAAAAPNNKRLAPPIAERPCPTKRIRSASTIPTPPPVVPPLPFPLPVQAPAPCSLVAARDPFCTETETLAAAHDDGLGFISYIDYSESDEGGCIWCTRAARCTNAQSHQGRSSSDQ
jgi:hypothetical protein